MTAAAFEGSIAATIPARRLGGPADIVGVALLLAGPAGDYILGQTINVDGGLVLS